MKIATVITAHNEGAEVAATARSMAQSIREPETELLIVIVDDGSTDGSCDCGLRIADCGIKVVRHEKPQGVGRARNAGLDVALEWGADVVSFHDGHMRFPEDVIEALAAKAVESGAIVTSKAKGWWFGEDHPQVKAGKVKAGDEHSFRAWGADMHWNSGYGLQPKYRLYPNKEPGGQPDWARVPCPMGACYVFGRRTIERLTAPTGRLWDDVAGRWGFSEQALAVKAFLLDIPVLVSRNLRTHHLYRSVSSVPPAEVWKNCCWSMAALLTEEAFDLRFRDFCEARLGKPEVKRIVTAARKDKGDRDPKTLRSLSPYGHAQREEMIFTHLCGRSPTITQPHSDHAWLEHLEDLRAEGDRTLKGVRGPVPLRILQWRPGESTVLLRDALPTAEITALEWVSHRTQNWRALCKRLGVKLHQTTLEAWTNPVQAGFLKGEAPFDLITIGGELADKCRPAAKALLAPGGRIVVNPTGDALQIEDAERKKVRDQLKAAGSRQRAAGSKAVRAKRAPAPPSSASPRLRGSPSVTVLLLNWKRAENVGLILNCLQGQTARPRVVVWDNGFGEEGGLKWSPAHGGMMHVHEHPLVDFAVYSSRNLGCFPRWQMAAHLDTEYVCSLDDDLMFKDPRVLEDAIAAHRTLCPDGIVGMFGVQLQAGKSYKGSKHINGRVQGDARVDLVKGRFMLLRREQLQDLPTVHPAARREDYIRADDILLSFCISGGQPGRHLVPGVLGKRWQEVGEEDARSLACNPGHFELRGDLVKRLQAYYEQRHPQITQMSAENGS